MNSIIARFNQPFPEKKGLKNVVITAFWVGTFIAAFLYFFQPFGFRNARFSILAYTIGFGLITFVTIIAFELFTTYLIGLERDTDDWTLWKWMLIMLALIFCISIGNYVFLLYLVRDSFSFSGFAQMAFSTFVLGIFPTVVSGMLIQINAIKRNERQAEQLKPQPANQISAVKRIKLVGQNADQFIDCSTDQLLYLEAQSNYVSIVLNEQGTIRKESIRNTLQNIQAQLSSDQVLRCHRSFLINPTKIISIRGNAQGLRLSLDGLPNEEIPVSRSYMKVIKEELSALQRTRHSGLESESG